MAYGTIGADVIQTSGVGLTPIFKDLNGDDIGVIPVNPQLAKAWVNFDGTLSGTITPRASYNITNITKNSTGDYTINFTNAMTDANYVVIAMGKSSTAAYGQSWSTNIKQSTTPSTTSFTIVNSYQDDNSNTVAYVDSASMMLVVFGN